MEDVVAIRASDSSGKRHFFVTWGRVFDRTDPQSLLDAVRHALPRFGLPDVDHLEACATLQEASDQPYFFEALLYFARQPISDAKDRGAWEESCREKISSGKDVYYLGTAVT